MKTPAEASLASSAAPSPGAHPFGASSLPTPGAGGAVTRVPTAPTLPEPDPTSLLVGQRLALDDTDHGHGANPFGAPLDFSSLARADALPFDVPAGLPTSFQIPIVDDAPAATTTTPGTTPTTPGTTPTTPGTTPTAASTTFAHAHDAALPAGITHELQHAGGAGFDAHALKSEFPILATRVHGKPLVWLDNAATTQKPRAVIERLTHFYEHENSNIHRAAHALAARATDAYEAARESVRRFVHARSVRDVVFVRGTTEGINLVAQSWGRSNVQQGDEIVVTHLEHHANIVPWQMLCAQTGAVLRVAPVDDRGDILLPAYEALLNKRTKLVALPQVSNALGTVTPAAVMIAMAHRHGAKVLLDGAQSVSHMHTDVTALGCDFFVFSGHKVFGPTGIGAVIADAALLDETPPWQGGGNMIADVTFERTIYQPAPARFEAGTGNIADAVGLGAALDWLTRVGVHHVERHEHDLLQYGTQRLHEVPGLRIIGNAVHKAGVLSFVVDGHDTHAISTALDREGIAVRGGHHCAQPILRRFGLQTTVRASLAPYNTRDDLDALVDALCRIVAAR